jgi:hypothetical protein
MVGAAGLGRPFVTGAAACTAGAPAATVLGIVGAVV